jgi:adenylate cyclase
MNGAEPQHPPSRFDPYVRTVQIFERPVSMRPVHDTFEGIAEWQVGPARQIRDGIEAFDEFAWRILATGLPLLRLQLHSSTLHPQFLGVTFVWWRTTGQSTARLIGHEVGDMVRYEDNPVRRVVLGGETIRRRLDVPDAVLDFEILHELKEIGATDYLALPIASAHGHNYMLSYVTDRPGGFSETEIAQLLPVSQRLAIVADIHSQRAISQNLLSFYLGAKTGPRVLAGQIRRGTGEEITAVLWSSDLRGFTARSDRLPGERVIALLNKLFDAQAEAIQRHGGEILKFIGDGLLAIFPIQDAEIAAEATRDALAAGFEALSAVRRLNNSADGGEPPLEIVVALHVGTVLYGNIGAADRLDFTVIGPAVNLVSRVEAMAKALNRPLVVSDDFARVYGEPLESLGRHELRGLSAAHELFAPEPPRCHAGVPNGAKSGEAGPAFR